MNDRTQARDHPVLALYLPQFHCVPENDAWWGAGFTEWTNVVRARPRFPGHYQPQLPTELGFYDLRVPETREAQSALAREHGIAGFCYYHYWFKGRGVLDRVFNEVRGSGRPDFPFCLCWANENWTRAWDASEQEILLPQEYDPDDDREHIAYLINAFRDPRYFTISGHPLFMIYRVQSLPEPERTWELLRSECNRVGIPEPIIGKFDTHGNFDDPAKFGCDVAAQFPPHGVGEWVPQVTVPGCDPGNVVFSYEQTVQAFCNLQPPRWTRFPGVFPSWDNSPRRADGASLLFVDNTPEEYERWLNAALAVAETHSAGTPVFVNAWNEWAEGAHLEPDERHGRAFLEATARATLGFVPSRSKQSRPVPDPVDLPTFTDLYLDLYEDYVLLQRAMTALLGTFERKVAGAVQQERERHLGVLDDATQLEQEVQRLQAELRSRRH